MNELKPVMVFAAGLLALGIGGTLFFLFGTSPAPFFGPNSGSEIEQALFYVVLTINFLYVVTGLGLLMLKRWAFLISKYLLYVNAIAFPIGTLISWFMLKYFRDPNVERNFR
jgi:hypothetical protein